MIMEYLTCQRKWWMFQAYVVCSIKGFMAFVFRKPEDKRIEWMGDFFGWDVELMFDRHGRELWAEQITLPRGSKTHHRTDLLVEWVRGPGPSQAQRGTKLLCFVGSMLGIFGFAAGFGLAWWLV